MRRTLLALLAALLLSPAQGAGAAERILDYQSDIQVFPDGSMSVRETIRVRAEGREIRRGIYRDFPTEYRDRFGNRVRVEFTVLEVLRDGNPEPFHTERRGSGVRVYIGREDRFLRPGEYGYTLVYRTDRQLGFFANHDELYWNVTGNDWAFPIEHAGARVLLPSTIPYDALVPEGYTGARGAKGQDYRALVEHDGAVRFETTRALARGEGLTIVIAWPKGHVTEPSTARKLGYLLSDNAALLAGLIGLALVLVYYLSVWGRYGRDPTPGVVIPRYQPPEGFSPASIRYVRRMEYDHKAFAAALVNLAVKGAVTLSEEDGRYIVRRTGAKAEMAPGERAMIGHLVNKKRESLTLERANHERIRNATRAHKQSLANDYDRLYFRTNRSWMVPGAAISLLAVAAAAFLLPSGDEMAVSLFLTVWLSIWTVGVLLLLRKVRDAWRGMRSLSEVAGALFITAFSIPFLAGEGFGLWMLMTEGSPALALVLGGALAINALFYQLMKAPTRAGRRLLDELEGFRLYLEVAEKDELDFRNPPDKTPELFERFLPYALALDVEQRWAERFAGVFADLESEGASYQPRWYSGPNWNSADLSGFSSAVGSSLGSAVASSSTAPGSSSGSGGGGSSGGGGGGGGGGGW